MAVVTFVILVQVVRSIRIVEKGTSLIIERNGKFHRRLDAGIYFLLPWIDRPRPIIHRTYDQRTGHGSQSAIEIIDLREAIMDFPVQDIITRDNVEIKVHPMLLYRIVDPVRAVYEVYDLPLAVEKLVQTTLRSIIGDMGLDDTLASREEINRALQQKISRVFLNWGFKISKVDILEINPATTSIQAAMDKQLCAERLRRASVLASEGIRDKLRTEAEGNAGALIAKSKGEQQVMVINSKAAADAKLLKANAEAEAIRIIAAALTGFDVDSARYIISLKYIEALKTVSLKAKARYLYIPLEHDVAGSEAALIADS